MLSNPVIQELPVLLVLNKNRSPVSLDISLVYNIFNLDAILKHAPASVKVCRVTVKASWIVPTFDEISDMMSWCGTYFVLSL